MALNGTFVKCKMHIIIPYTERPELLRNKSLTIKTSFCKGLFLITYCIHPASALVIQEYVTVNICNYKCQFVIDKWWLT